MQYIVNLISHSGRSTENVCNCHKIEAVCLRCEFDSCFLVCVFAHFSSEEWNKVSKSEREKLGVTVQDDGEFW